MCGLRTCRRYGNAVKQKKTESGKLSVFLLLFGADVNVLLREGNLDVVGVEGVVDGGEHLTLDGAAIERLYPDEELEVDTGVAKL